MTSASPAPTSPAAPVVVTSAAQLAAVLRENVLTDLRRNAQRALTEPAFQDGAFGRAVAKLGDRLEAVLASIVDDVVQQATTKDDLETWAMVVAGPKGQKVLHGQLVLETVARFVAAAGDA